MHQALLNIYFRLALSTHDLCPARRTGTYPVAWFHAPKTGTSFGTTLAHHANASLPPNAAIRDCKTTKCIGFESQDLTNRFPPRVWFHGQLWLKSGNWGGHEAISDAAYEQWKGSFYGMFREPWRRTMSALAYFAPKSNLSALAYVNNAKGGVTLQLTGQRYGLSCLWPRRHGCTHPKPDVAKALQRLEGFAFVGLTEEWALSICLFHLKFKTPCLANEFLDTRPTNYSASSQARSESKPLVHDSADLAVYAAVQLRFWREVAQYGARRTGASAAAPHQRALGPNKFLLVRRANSTRGGRAPEWAGRGARALSPCSPSAARGSARTS